MLDRSAGRGRALCADDFDPVGLLGIKDSRHIAARAAEMRLDDLQNEAGGNSGVKGIAALFEDSHADGGCDPMRGGNDAEGAEDFGASGKIGHSWNSL
ncbi:hypothetical protein D3C87_1752380 [compost metagenome]